METQKNHNYQKRIQERLSILRAEIEELTAALKVINQLDEKFKTPFVNITEPKGNTTNLGILQELIKEGESQHPPVYYSSGELIKKFAVKKNKTEKSVQAIVYNTLSVAGRNGGLNNESGKWKTK